MHRLDMEEERRICQKKRKRKVYFCRGIAVLCFGVVFFLSCCGVLFLGEHLFSKEAVADASGIITGEGISRTEQIMPSGTAEKQSYDFGMHRTESSGLIILDAGHGGKDGGSVKGKAQEKDINLELAVKLKNALELQGLEVLMTREEDEFLELSERAEFANKQSARLFVSLHCNYYEKDSSVRGLECYYYPDSEKGRFLAEGICETLRETGKIKVREAKAEDYYVLRSTACTAILIEAGYLSNSSDRANLLDEEYLEELARELSEEICRTVQE